MSSQQGRKIALAGASGTVGTPTLSALRKAAIHTLTVISRTESDATFPSDVNLKKGDYNDEAFLVSALTGQDVLILQLGIFGTDQQSPLIKAAAKAGVRYILPIEFGSDIYAPFAKTFHIMSMKKQYRDLIEELGMSWIAIINNPWFDWSLKKGTWGIDIKNRKASLYKGAEAKFNTSTLDRVGKGVADLLALPESQLEKFQNSPAYFSSFELTQREILESAIRVTGSQESDWDITVLDADRVIAGSREEVANGNPIAFVSEFYLTHMLEGTGGNYQEKIKQNPANLAWSEEKLDDVVKAVVESLQ
ncbi:hypothetical protein NX059_010027 [Plenodomus lindquistii]|nr:hypothetical protein NX059_010027 [Plenodomus lindquistii]